MGRIRNNRDGRRRGDGDNPVKSVKGDGHDGMIGPVDGPENIVLGDVAFGLTKSDAGLPSYAFSSK